MHALGVRYSGSYTSGDTTIPRVGAWSLWNEPNFGQELAPQALRGSLVAPRLYRALVDAGWSALQRAGHRRDAVLIGNLSPRGFSGARCGLLTSPSTVTLAVALWAIRTIAWGR